MDDSQSKKCPEDVKKENAPESKAKSEMSENKGNLSEGVDKKSDNKQTNLTAKDDEKRTNEIKKENNTEKSNKTDTKEDNKDAVRLKEVQLIDKKEEDKEKPKESLVDKPENVKERLIQDEVNYSECAKNMNSNAPPHKENKDESIPLRSKEAGDQEAKKEGGLPARWITAILGCIGFMIVYGLKVNLSVAIIAMVNHTAVAAKGAHHGDDEHDDHHSGDNITENDCGVTEKAAPLMDGPFDWDENIQGIILAAYFYGYFFTQVPGGWVAEKFSAKHVFGVGALANALLALVSPLAANASYIWLIVVRIGMGIAGGVTLPGMHVLIANWAPPAERSKISSTIYAGMTLGTLVCMPFSGLLASALDWSAVFYVQGGLSLIWYILWLFFVYDSPAVHPRISASEKKYIQESLGTVVKTEKDPIPWKSVWTSLPVWAIIVAHTCSNWGWYMLLVKLPTYMRYILKFDIKSNAGISAIPFLCMWIFTMLLANILDALRGRKIISTTFARKFATSVACLPPAICLIGVTYVGCNTDLAVALLTLGTMFVGGMYSGFLSNHIDIAPQFAGTLMGITNTFATVPGIVVPSFVGYMTHGNQTVEAWRTIFFITLGIFSFEWIFYCAFASGEEQSWAKPKSRTDPEEQKLNEGL